MAPHHHMLHTPGHYAYLQPLPVEEQPPAPSCDDDDAAASSELRSPSESCSRAVVVETGAAS
jgi:hypothetical protein